MKKRLLCVLVAAVLLIGVLAGCGDSPSDSPNSDKPGVGSTEPEKLDKGDQTDDDPMEIMEARVKAVNDAINYKCVGLEETVEAGLLFYKFDYYLAGPDDDKNRDYNPDKPLDYDMSFSMRKAHTEGIVSEDTYVALLKNEYKGREVVASDVIETDDLYVYYHSYLSAYSSCLSDHMWWDSPTGDCYILVKGTDIVYSFSVKESWTKPNYFECSFSYRPEPPYVLELAYASDDAEYIFTDEFWQAFAQTVKFVGNADDDFKNSECLNVNVQTMGRRGKVKIPYVEGWYVGGTWSREAIRKGFESFVKNFLENREREVEVVFYLDDGTEKRYPAIKSGGEVTIDLGNGQVWRYNDEGGYLALLDEPDYVTGERLPNGAKGYLIYKNDITSPLVIDDFGQGEPTMFFNNGLYKYAGNDEATLIHDFSGIEENWYWTSIYTDADRTHLMFSGGPLHSEELKIVDLKTFEVTDEVYVLYDADSNGMWEFWEAEVNGVTVDESTAWAAADQWRSICNIALCDTDINYETDLNAAWKEYESRS